MRNQFIIFLAGFATILSSCIYTDFGEYFVVPVPGDPPVIRAETNLDSISDIIVTDSLEVTYYIQVENGEFYQAEAYLSAMPIYISDTIRGGFWVYGSMWEEAGVDTLTFYIYYSTNSNSLGDIVGVEANLLDLKFPITFEGVSE